MSHDTKIVIAFIYLLFVIIFVGEDIKQEIKASRQAIINEINTVSQ